MLSVNTIKKIDPALLLRVGLGATLIYAGLSILMTPDSWVGFVPFWVIEVIPLDVYVFLIIHGIFELLVGLFLVFGYFTRIMALVTFFDILSIVVFTGVDLVTFRDFGLMMAALALFILETNSQEVQN